MATRSRTATSRSGCCRERPRQVVCDDVLAVLRLGRLVYVDRRVYDEPRDGETDALALHGEPDRKSTRLNSSHVSISYAVFCWKKKIDHFIMYASLHVSNALYHNRRHR